MPAYMIFIRKGPVKDAAAMEKYQQLTMATMGDFKLIPRIVYGALESVEGAAPDGVVMLEFPSTDAAKAWYFSDAYQSAVKHRLAAADYDSFIVEGFDMQVPTD